MQLNTAINNISELNKYMNRFVSYSIFLSVLLFLYNCTSKTDYELMVQDGLQSGIEQDSLFLGYYFGMSSKDFFSHSWEMNHQGIITGQTKIVYELQDLTYPALMEFYPAFNNDSIARMPVSVGFQGWAPWNEHLNSNELINELIQYYGENYESNFRIIFIPEMNREAHVDIQGNREIRIYPESHSNVIVEFIDHSNQ
tara:strand:- start:89987 stop:90580 length:594 start_codon:yes stop_codon:yes gene_type:complete